MGARFVTLLLDMLLQLISRCSLSVDLNSKTRWSHFVAEDTLCVRSVSSRKETMLFVALWVEDSLFVYVSIVVWCVYVQMSLRVRVYRHISEDVCDCAEI